MTIVIEASMTFVRTRDPRFSQFAWNLCIPQALAKEDAEGFTGNAEADMGRSSTNARIASLLLTMAFLGTSATAQEPAGAQAGQGAAGSDKAAFNNHCRTCHSPREGDNRLGPALGKIIGQKAGTRPDYPNYSKAMVSSGITWDEATLDRFIADPEAVVPNNNMKPFKGVTDAAVRKRIIAAMR